MLDMIGKYRKQVEIINCEQTKGIPMEKTFALIAWQYYNENNLQQIFEYKLFPEEQVNKKNYLN
jgi:hypothetical protein